MLVMMKMMEMVVMGMMVITNCNRWKGAKIVASQRTYKDKTSTLLQRKINK